MIDDVRVFGNRWEKFKKLFTNSIIRQTEDSQITFNRLQRRLDIDFGGEVLMNKRSEEGAEKEGLPPYQLT